MSFGAKAAGDKAGNVWANDIQHALGDGNPAQAASYVVFLDGATYKARNGKDGTIDFSGANKATVQQATVDALATAGGGTIVLHDMTLDGGVTYGNTILIVKEYQGTHTSYSGGSIEHLSSWDFKVELEGSSYVVRNSNKVPTYRSAYEELAILDV